MSLLDFDNSTELGGGEGQGVTSGDPFDPFSGMSSTGNGEEASSAGNKPGFDDFDPFADFVSPTRVTITTKSAAPTSANANDDPFGDPFSGFPSSGGGGVDASAPSDAASNPFSGGGDDPFGLGSPAPESGGTNPFCGGGDFTSAGDDPFGLGSVSADSGANTTNSSNPFGAADNSDPFGGFESNTAEDTAVTAVTNEKSKMADLDAAGQQALSAQFDDLMGDMTLNGDDVSTTFTMTTTKTVVEEDGLSSTVTKTTTSTTSGRLTNGEGEQSDEESREEQSRDWKLHEEVSREEQSREQESHEEQSREEESRDWESRASKDEDQGDDDTQSQSSNPGQDGVREMKAMDYMKQRYETSGGRAGGKQDLQARPLRQPKKLDRPWTAEERSGSFDGHSKKLKVKIGPGEQDMIAYSALGVDYRNKAFERSGSTDSSGPRSPRTPSKWDPDLNRPRPPVVNKQTVEKLPPPQITKNVRQLFESGSIPDEHEVKKVDINLYESEEAGVYESSPIVRDGVVRETDVQPDKEVLERGKTSSIASNWSSISAEKPVERRQITLAEDAGYVLETTPMQRQDVIRESDQADTAVPLTGTAAAIRHKYINREEAKVERAPINIYEGGDRTPLVIENEPAPTLQECINNMEDQEVKVQPGKIRNMASYFSTKGDGPVERKPVELCREEDGIILENVPIKRDNVIRECDEVGTAVQIERGTASNLKSRFENQREEYVPRGFKMDVEMNGPTMLENEPIQRTDVVREDHVVEEVIPGESGRARKLASRFLNPDELETHKVQRTQIIIERDEAPTVLENQPIERTDVVKCDVDYRRGDPVLSEGSTRNKVGFWLNRKDEVQQLSEEERRLRWQLEIEEARARQAADVIENEPECNPEFEYQEEETANLPEAHTKSMRSRWQQMQEEEERRRMREECPELVRFTPPRELTPPPLRQNEPVQSYQTLTLGGGTSAGDSSAAYSQFNGYDQAYDSYTEQNNVAPNAPVMTSSTKISLRQA